MRNLFLHTPREAEDKNCSCPAVFIHSGVSEYVPYVLSQFHVSNPDMVCFLIGDRKASFTVSSGIKYLSISDYTAEADRFTALYCSQHRSYTPFANENACFRRTFILESFCRKYHLPSCLHFDSDVLVYGNMLQEITALPESTKWTAVGSKLLSPHSSFWTLEKLSEFNRFLFDCITPGTKEYRHLDQFWNTYRIQHTTGGVCDMTALQLFSEWHPDGFLQMNGTPGGEWNGTVYESYPEMTPEQKTLPADIFRKGDFFYFHGKRMLTIHCQGFTKKFIAVFFTGKKDFRHYGIMLFIFCYRILASVYHIIKKTDEK